MFILLLAYGESAWGEEPKLEIPIYSYYLSPPFHFPETNTGLVREVIDELDANTDTLDFQLEKISRTAVDMHIRDHVGPMLVAFANPVWFGDSHRSKYLWSRPLFTDYNALISSSLDSVEFKGKNTFIGKTIGVPKGYKIYLLDDLVAAGKARRKDTVSMKTLVHKVYRQKISMGIIPNPVARYVVSQEGLQEHIYFSTRPHQTYDRHLMLVNGNRELIGEIDRTIYKMRESGALARILKSYNIELNATNGN